MLYEVITGHRCVGSRVNGKLVPLKTPLHNGDIVEVITSQNHTPSKDWIKFVRTSKARNKIRQWIKTEQREKSIELGRELLVITSYSIHYTKLYETHTPMSDIGMNGIGKVDRRRASREFV